MESHVSEVNMKDILQSTCPGWRFDSNHSSAENGRIIIVWDPALSVIVFKKTAQFVFYGIHNPDTNTSFNVAFVYAQMRKSLDEICGLIFWIFAKPPLLRIDRGS